MHSLCKSLKTCYVLVGYVAEESAQLFLRHTMNRDKVLFTCFQNADYKFLATSFHDSPRSSHPPYGTLQKSVQFSKTDEERIQAVRATCGMRLRDLAHGRHFQRTWRYYFMRPSHAVPISLVRGASNAKRLIVARCYIGYTPYTQVASKRTSRRLTLECH